MMDYLCPACGQALPMDPVEAQAESIRQWCRDTGVPILLGDCLRRSDAAAYLGRSEKTLANWSSCADPIATTKLNRRTYYPIPAIAKFIVEESSR